MHDLQFVCIQFPDNDEVLHALPDVTRNFHGEPIEDFFNAFVTNTGLLLKEEGGMHHAILGLLPFHQVQHRHPSGLS